MYRKHIKPQTGAKQGIPGILANPDITAPVREIHASYRSVTGRLWSNKNRRHVGYESFGEKRVFLALEVDPLVLRYCEQPISIPYVDEEGIERSYTPDVCIDYNPELSSLPPLLVEFKYSRELLEAKKWERLRPKLQAGLEYAKANGLNFTLWTEQDLHPDQHHHVSALRTLLRGTVDPVLEVLVLDRLRHVGPTTVVALVAALKNEASPESATRVIWGAVASAKIHADLTIAAHPSTRIWPVVTGGAHV
jgi:hypothetical protein